MFDHDYDGTVLQFGEVVMFRRSFNQTSRNRIGKAQARFEKGVWLGKDYKSDEHLCGIVTGVLKVRSIRKLPEELQSEVERLTVFTGVPWDMGSERIPTRPRGPQAVPQELIEKLPPTAAPEEVRAEEGQSKAASKQPVPEIPSGRASAPSDMGQMESERTSDEGPAPMTDELQPVSGAMSEAVKRVGDGHDEGMPSPKRVATGSSAMQLALPQEAAVRREAPEGGEDSPAKRPRGELMLVEFPHVDEADEPEAQLGEELVEISRGEKALDPEKSGPARCWRSPELRTGRGTRLGGDGGHLHLDAVGSAGPR